MVCPLLDFFARYGAALAVVTLLFMGCYRLTEFTMGSMANTFYIDRGYTLTQIAAVVKLYGLAMSLVGVVIAGIVVARLGLLRSLLARQRHDHAVEHRLLAAGAREPAVARRSRARQRLRQPGAGACTARR